jgi:hypothetical protein
MHELWDAVGRANGNVGEPSSSSGSTNTATPVAAIVLDLLLQRCGAARARV